MESLMFDVIMQWLLYAVSALVCFWAWDKMFFWLTQKDLKAIVRILGAVLLFTPAPLDLDSPHYAPAFIVILFRTFLENNAPVLDAVIYMLVGLFIGLILMSLLSLFNFIRAKFSPQN
jgi:signal transduction histidine kinase